MKSSGEGNANGKIILMGEHSVVYGKPAIAFPFQPTHVTAEITDHIYDALRSDYFVGPLAKAPKSLENIKTLIHQLRHDFSTPPVQITISSTIPAERGMGSSAAVAVAITRAFFDWQNLPLSHELLLTYVNYAEKISHGNPSGIDAAATAGDEPILFQKGAAFETFPINISGFLIVADTGVKGKTRQTVKAVAQRFEQDNKTTGHLINELGDLTLKAKKAILNNQAAYLGELMNAAQKNLAALQVSDQTLDNLIMVANQNGALGAKLTGGGKGGCMIALASDYSTAKKITTALTNQGAKATWIQELGVYQYA